MVHARVILLAVLRSRGVHLAALLAVAAACARFELHDESLGTSVHTVTDMNMTSSEEEFDQFTAAWPSICGRAEGEEVCVLSYRGRSDAAGGLRPIRKALVLLGRAYLCQFNAVQPSDDGMWMVSNQQYQNGTFRGGNLVNPLRVDEEPTRAAFVRLCRALRTQ